MRDLVCDPHGQQVWAKSEAEGLVIRPTGEVLETDEGDPSSAHHQLPSVRAADAHHEVYIERSVDREQVFAPARRLLGNAGDVDSVHQRPQIPAVGLDYTAYYVISMRAVKVENVVVPVG